MEHTGVHHELCLGVSHPKLLGSIPKAAERELERGRALTTAGIAWAQLCLQLELPGYVAHNSLLISAKASFRASQLRVRCPLDTQLCAIFLCLGPHLQLPP